MKILGFLIFAASLVYAQAISGVTNVVIIVSENQSADISVPLFRQTSTARRRATQKRARCR